jgi:hypothetical protein
MATIYYTKSGAAASSGWWFATYDDAENAIRDCYQLNGEDAPSEVDDSTIVSYEAPEAVLDALDSGECEGSPESFPVC